MGKQSDGEEEDRMGKPSDGEEEATGSGVIRPIGWLQTTPATGPVLTEEVRAAFFEAKAEFSTKKNTTTTTTKTGGEPPASSLFVSLDIVRSGLPGGGGGGACVEVYDLGTGGALDFELSGVDEGEEDD